MKLIRLLAFACCLALAPCAWAQNTAPAAPVLPGAAAMHLPAQTPAAGSSVPAAETPVGSSAPAASDKKPLTVLPPIPLAPIATQLGQTLQSLVGVATSQPAATGSSTPAAASAPADAEDAGQDGDTLASTVLDMLAHQVERLKADSATFAATMSALPDFIDWARHQGSDARRAALWHGIGVDLLVIVGIPLLGAIAVALILLPLRQRLRQHEPQTVPGRVGTLLALFALRVVPVMLFTGAGLLLLDQNEIHRLPRFVVLDVIYALTLAYTVRQGLRAIFAPATDHLRLFSFTTPQAVYAFRWFGTFSTVIIMGYFLVEIATALHVPFTSIVMFQNILGLALTAMAITVILQTRVAVALILRGEPGDGQATFAVALRGWLARHWHSLAIAYLIISLCVTVLGIDNGIALMLRGTILTLIILAVSRLLFLALDRWVTPTANNSALMHRQILSFILRPFIWVMAVLSIAAVWGFRFRGIIATPGGQRVTGAFISVAITLFVLTVIYEMLNSSIERHLGRRDKEGKQPVASARARTLLPMVRNTVFILFSGVAVLTALSAVGVNIAPVLAGAGVVGVAIGFGSQSLVKDFLTGLFIVVENTVAVGDVVTIGGLGGVVETISIRTIRLRDSDGTLHILPFSEVSKISNMTKGFAYALVDVGVAYDSDMDLVTKTLRDIGAQMQEDPIFKRVILEPVEVTIEKFGDSTVTMRARIRTRPGKQWDVKRLLMLKILKRFAEEKIDIPYPTVTNLTKMIGEPATKAE